jgi:hypothetical protein
MVFELDHENILEGLDCKYFFASQHRNHANAEKSQWQISMPEEIECFIEAKSEGWAGNQCGWGLKLDADQNLEVLGTNTHHEHLKIAKFIDSSKNSIWHGYPADYIRKSQDRPNVEVLRSWKDKGVISKYHMTRIRGGKACNL